MGYFSNILFTKKPLKIENSPSIKLVRFEHEGGRIDSSHKVNNLERKFLVWTGKFKNVNEVPAFVSQSTMERCRNRMRIKIANYMMLATAIGCLGMVYLGKQDAKKGISLTRQNLDWHNEIKAQKDESNCCGWLNGLDVNAKKKNISAVKEITRFSSWAQINLQNKQHSQKIYCSTVNYCGSQHFKRIIYHLD